MQVRVGKTVISVFDGDIAQQDTEAVVNAANNHFWMGSGVAGAILRAGGKIIEDEAVAQGPVKVGGAVITSGGNLKAKYVIHAAAMGDGPVNVPDAVVNSLRLAEENKVDSVSFPALATGVAGFSMSECAKIMIDLVIKHAKKETCLKEIRFVLWGQDAFDVFAKELKKQAG